MPERYDINGNPIGVFSVEDEGMRYVDPTVIQPAVVSANRGYWEAQKWARENVRDPRERTAPYVAAGLGATMVAPVAIDLAASGLASAAADPLWKAAAKRMAIDLPAFEAIDRLPQAWGDDRLTTQGTNLIKQTTPIGQVAPGVVDVAGPFIAGMVPGMAGDMMVRGTAAGVNGVLNGIGRRITNNRMGYLAPVADVMNTETVSKFDIPAPERQMRYYVQDPVTKETTLIDADRAKTLVKQGVPEEYIIQEELKSTLSSKPVVEKASPAGYQIERYPGYQLKSLMAGNPLEKQLSKNGTISTNSIRALENKSSKVEQAVIDKVLASEGFAGQKVVDYNKFRKAVQDELITYDRTPDTRWNDYGISRLGLKESEDLSNLRNIETFAKSDRFEVVSTDTIGQARLWRDKETGDIINWDGITQRYLSEHDVINSGPGKNTFTFSSSRIPNGSAKHYDSNTLGHSRTYTTSDEPDVLHVMESQSDWAQGGGYTMPLSDLDKFELQQTEEILANNADKYGELNEWRRKTHEKMAAYLRDKIAKDWSSSEAQQGRYLTDNYTSRQIQENLRYAAERGQTKMRYPTRETAAKIEGYPERESYFDAEGNDVTKSSQSLYEFDKNIEDRIADLKRQRDKLSHARAYDMSDYRDLEGRNQADVVLLRRAKEQNDKALVEEYETIIREREELMADIKRYNEIQDEIKTLFSENETHLKPGITKKIVYDYEDILRKYTEFPKQYKKLFKGADVRTITDPKGNTWYEVDVPENYLQQEWPYKNGGLLDRLNKHYNGDRAKIIQVMQYTRGGFKRDAATDAGDQYYDIVRQRRNSAFNALLRAGMSPDDAARLAPMIVTQQTMEGGWVLNRKDNNYGGMKSAGKTIAFDSEDDFQDAYIKMLDSKWHNGRAVENSWRSARDLDDWARILNREDLGLTTKEAWERYNKGKQGDDFVYLYAPQWENNNKPYREHLKKTEDRAAAYLKMVDADEPYSSLVPKQEQPVAPIATSKKTTTMPGMFRALIPTSVQKLLNGKAAGGILLTDYASGGNIHIAPSKKGTFTAAAKKHGKSVQAFASQVLANKENYSPAMVKKANFARNFGGHKHGDGGYLLGGIYDLSEEQIRELIQQGYEIERI